MSKSTLKNSTGTLVAGFENWGTVTATSGTVTDTTGKVWTLAGNSSLTPSVGGSTSQASTSFGLSGPRVGYVAASNYIPGIAFENPSYEGAVLSASSLAGVERLKRHTKVNGVYVAETMVEIPTTQGRLVRPYVPVGEGPIKAMHTLMESYSPDNYLDYAGAQKIVM